MRSCALAGRRFVFASIVCLGIVLTVSLALAQSRPGGTAAPRLAGVQNPKREQVAAKVEELAARIGDLVEAKRQAEGADSALELYRDAAAGGKAMESILPRLANDAYQLNLMEVERDVMLDSTGAQNPRYLAMLKRVDQMKEAYARQLELGKAKAGQRLNELRLEAAGARGRLEEASKGVEAVKRELVDLASGA